jgi:hypothetical protein
MITRLHAIAHALVEGDRVWVEAGAGGPRVRLEFTGRRNGRLVAMVAINGDGTDFRWLGEAEANEFAVACGGTLADAEFKLLEELVPATSGNLAVLPKWAQRENLEKTIRSEFAERARNGQYMWTGPFDEFINDILGRAGSNIGRLVKHAILDNLRKMPGVEIEKAHYRGGYLLRIASILISGEDFQPLDEGNEIGRDKNLGEGAGTVQGIELL